jgi:hypothetical protein
VIQQLIEPHREDGKAKVSAEPAAQPAEAPAADRRVIEALIKTNRDKPQS